MEKFLVIILSRKRAAKQVTWRNLSPEIRQVTKIVVNADELEDYRQANPGVPIVPHNVNGEGPVRRWIMETFGPTCEHLFMLDDDMRLCVRKPNRASPIKCTDEEIDELFKLLNTWLSKRFTQVGISTRGGNNRVLEDYVENTRVMGFHGYNVKEFLASGADFCRLETMLDFDVTLQLLRSGRPNRVSYKYCWDQGGSNSPGGCSTYRTQEVLHRCAGQLAKLHAGFVIITKKKAKNWESFGAERFDVTINWKAAYESYAAKQRKPSKGLFKKGGR